MKTFIALYMAPAAAMQEMMKNSTPEDREKGMTEWLAWIESHSEHLMDPGAPAGKNRRITAEGASDERNEVGGYSLIRAESMEAAQDVLKDCPHFRMPGAYVDLMERIEM